MPKATILIVEDEQVVALDLWRSLENCGYQVVGQADRGEDALRKAAALCPDLVLMDIGLKGEVDGIEAATQIWARLHLPVIFLTAFADEATVRRARPAEPYGYVLKPFDERELASNIEIALYKHGVDKKLRESEARFHGVIEHASDGIVLADHQGNLVEWNPAAEQLTGLERSQVLGQPLLDIFADLIPAESRTPGLQAALANQWNPVVKSEPTGRSDRLVEFEIETPQGKRRVIQTHGFRIETGEGALMGASLRDTTERKRADEAVRESEERFRGLFEYSPISLWEEDFSAVKVWLDNLRQQGVTDTEAYFACHPEAVEECLRRIKVLDVNQATVRLYGAQSKGELLNHVGQVFGPETRQMIAEELAAIARGEREFESEGVNHKLTGERMDVNLRWFIPSAHAQSLSQIVISIIDTTERKRTEEEKGKLFRILEASLNEIYIFDPHSLKFSYVNEATLLNIGYTFNEVKELTPIDLKPEFTENAFRETIAPLLDGEKESLVFQTVHRRKDGSVYPVEVHLQVVQTGSEKVFLAVIYDITERKRAERLIQAQQEQLTAQNEELMAQNEELAAQSGALEAAEAELRRMNSELEQRVQARSAELRAANAELQSANAAILRAGRMKDEFLANMSHELRTPLTGILGLAELLHVGIYGDLSEQQRQALTKLQVSGEHLLQLINDILDLSKIEAGKVELQIAPALVEELCQASLEFIKQTAHKRNLRLIFQPDAQVRRVQADERRLKQMLVNLLSNAVKFTPEGGQVGLEVAGDPARQQLRFTVWDTGIGIAPEQQALLFQPFVQLDGSLTRKYEGTGLGLALVHSMAELHGGSVTVASAGLGQGARFTITLPWNPEPLPSTPAFADTAKATSRFVSLAALLGRPPVILAADDNSTIRIVLTSFLEALECQVITAQNGAEALAQAQAAQPDLILLDIHMPDLDGLTVVRRLRAAGSRVPVIALTALAMPDDRDQCLAAGADDYLSKPMSLDELTRAITQLLARPKPSASPTPLE